jgi:hypothetical protein
VSPLGEIRKYFNSFDYLILHILIGLWLQGSDPSNAPSVEKALHRNTPCRSTPGCTQASGRIPAPCAARLWPQNTRCWSTWACTQVGGVLHQRATCPQIPIPQGGHFQDLNGFLSLVSFPTWCHWKTGLCICHCSSEFSTELSLSSHYSLMLRVQCMNMSYLTSTA